MQEKKARANPMTRNAMLAVVWCAATGAGFCGLARAEGAPKDKAPADAPGISGTVAETMDGDRYTYALLANGTDRVWVASFRFDAKTGDTVRVVGGIPMANFTSKTLERTFDRILFVSDVWVGTNHAVTASLPVGHPRIDDAGPAAEAPAAAPAWPSMSGKVLETMNAGGYTYVRVKTSNETFWAATMHLQVKAGDQVSVPKGALMKNFESPTLKRTFDEIYFVDRIRVEGKEQPSALPPGHPPIPASP
jgi:hypothetical protein